MEKILDVRDLNISFNTYNGKVHAVRNLHFYLGKGETLGMVGESGCGKTVTSKAILNLLSEDNVEVSTDSKVIFEGKNVLEMNKRELMKLRGSDISMIFQDPMTFLNPTMKVGEQIAESLIIHKNMKKHQALKEAIKIMNLVDIPNSNQRIKSYPHEFSGGQRQRIIIAMALICKPKILVADEPTTSLDVTTQANIMDLIEELKSSFDTSIILVTHDLAVAAEVCDRIQVVYAGKIVETASTSEIFNSPKHPYTLALLQSVSAINSTNKGNLYSLKGSPPDLFSPPMGCAFAPRCKYGMNICQRIAPESIAISNTHHVSCWLEHKQYKER